MSVKINRQRTIEDSRKSIYIPNPSFVLFLVHFGIFPSPHVNPFCIFPRFLILFFIISNLLLSAKTFWATNLRLDSSLEIQPF